ncbi:DUF4214 domain-containing protein [Noviherbaspirillum sp. ST9]|uniref:DUF4214 domain-containing protein n=1 Tax=Noviherbaspirillum sp. ST9 TaxID=3401606 RepID=UPI003B58A36D
MAIVSTQQNTVIAKPISGDYRIDVLLDDASTRWNRSAPVGSPVEVTYSFMTSAPTYTAAEHKNGFAEFTVSQKVAAREIFSLLGQQLNISFREVLDFTSSYGQIRLGNNDQGDDSAGYAMLPDADYGDDQGDVYINNIASNRHAVTPGTYAYGTLVHEIAHALGLKHPGNYNGTSNNASLEPGNYLAASEDSEANSIMSYISTPQQQQRVFLGMFDLLALQYLYGARAYATKDNQYSYSNSTGDLHVLINDNGGTDTIDASSVSIGATVDLRDGSFSSIGVAFDGSAAVGNVSIMIGSVIENAIGTVANDRMIGNAVGNVFSPGRGNDTIDGGLGHDTVIVGAERGNFVMSRNGTSVTATDNSGAFGSKVITGVERIKFSDAVIAFDTDGVAGQAYRLYQAAFDRTPDAGGLGYWIDYLEEGASLVDAAAGFFNSAEFKGLYGASPSNADLVTRFYQNVLHRAPGQSEVDWWTTELSRGMSATQALVNFSASPENQAQVIGVIQNGMEFIPVA